MSKFKYCSVIVVFLALISCGNENSIEENKSEFPEPIGYINDFDDVFNKAQENELDSIVLAFEKKTDIDLVVLTISPENIADTLFDDYTFRMANHWGVGKKGKDNGILVCFSLKLKRISIHNGHGIENILSDEETKLIIDNFFLPWFSNGDYFMGTKMGVIGLIDKLEENL